VRAQAAASRSLDPARRARSRRTPALRQAERPRCCRFQYSSKMHSRRACERRRLGSIASPFAATEANTRGQAVQAAATQNWASVTGGLPASPPASGKAHQKDQGAVIVGPRVALPAGCRPGSELPVGTWRQTPAQLVAQPPGRTLMVLEGARSGRSVRCAGSSTRSSGQT